MKMPMSTAATAAFRELSFKFSGYTIWLTPRDTDLIVAKTLQRIATDLSISRVPSPHFTLIYDASFESDAAAMGRFGEVKKAVREFPALQCTGCVMDVELAGVNGGLMDMAWAEISYKRAEEGRESFEKAIAAFTGNCSEGMWEKWVPHMSLAYDEPRDRRLDIGVLVDAVRGEPGLMQEKREIVGMELWRTEGRMAEWEKLDYYEF